MVYDADADEFAHGLQSASEVLVIGRRFRDQTLMSVASKLAHCWCRHLKQPMSACAILATTTIRSQAFGLPCPPRSKTVLS